MAKLEVPKDAVDRAASKVDKRQLAYSRELAKRSSPSQLPTN
jgi:hypothetical protein